MNQPQISRRSFLHAPVALAIGASGCDALAEETLNVATSWPEADCRKIESEFRRWSSEPGERLDRPTRIQWVRLQPGADLARHGSVLRGVDVVLGGSIASYQRLAAMGGLALIENRAAWRVGRQAPIGVAIDPGAFSERRLEVPTSWADLGRAGYSGLVALGDFRGDPTSFALAVSRLGTNWIGGYGELVRIAANAPRIFTSERGAETEITRARASLGPSIRRSGDWIPIAGGAILEEGVGIVREAKDLDRANAFLRHFGSFPAHSLAADDFRVDNLLAELLGATLVDAHEELRRTWSILIKQGDSASLRTLVSPPSWPPAIVGRLQSSKNQAPLVETLAAEIATDPLDRSWLLESWSRPEQMIDGALIRELAAVGGGRLADDFKFRAWLRSEWTAWARTRYRALGRSARDRRS